MEYSLKRDSYRISHSAHVSTMSELPFSLLNITARSRPKVVVLDQGPSEISQSSNDNTCPICRERQARYTCPRCRSPYCSAACYKNHSTCTEQFYKDRVSQVLELEVNAKRDEMKRILNRTYQSEINDIPQDELLQLLETLEAGNEKDIEKMMENPKFKDALQYAIQNDNLHEWILQPWHPWWKNQLDLTGIGDDENSCHDTIFEQGHIETIDERLLSVPAFNTLWPASKEKRPELEFNTIDILYSFAWTMRIFHGLENAKEIAIQSTMHLIQSSAVLSRDARFDSLAQVLSDRTAASTLAESRNSCNTCWTALADDVCCICTNPRLMGRALLEITDLMQIAASEAKRAGDKSSSTYILRLKRKVEFYLSWTQAHSLAVTKLVPLINDWTATWEMVDTEELNIRIDHSQQSLKLNTSSNSYFKGQAST